jgi:hypothetical protein
MKVNLKSVYNQVLQAVPTNWDVLNQDLSGLTASSYWLSLKTYLESCIGDVLAQADDLSAVIAGTMTEEEFGRRAIIDRIVADKMQQILDHIEGLKPNETK